MKCEARYEPTTLLNEVNKIIEHAFRPVGSVDSTQTKASHWNPAIDIQEGKNQFVVIADLPGVNKEDITISMENNIIIVKGSRANPTAEEQYNYFRVERPRGEFCRRFTLPDIADSEKIEATLKNGILRLVIPKKDIAQPKIIKIQSDDN